VRRCETLRLLADRLRPVFEKYGVLRAILFGSYARGDNSRRSDVDLILVQETDKRFLDRYAGILWDITANVPGCDVDLLIYTPSELEAISDRPFVATALREGVVLYESTEEPASG
jgi:predicted nucleotidyltransferase